MAVPIISLDDVKVHLPIRAGNTDYDTKIQFLIEVASAEIETALDRELDSRSRTELFRTPDTAHEALDFSSAGNETGYRTITRPVRYTLKAFNVDSGTLLVYYDPSGVFAADTLINSDYITLNAALGLITVIYPMIRTMDGLKVVYTGGYADDAGSPATLSGTIPSDIKMACISQVLYLWARTSSDNAGKDEDSREGNKGGSRFSVKGGLVPEASALISRYKALGVGIH